MKNSLTPRGYVGIVSALIVSGILTALILAESTEIFWSIASENAQEDHLRAQALAGSCAYEALLLFAENPSQLASSTPETFPVSASQNSDFCTIDSATSTILTHAQSQKSFAALEVSVSQLSSGFISIITWRDITSIPP